MKNSPTVKTILALDTSAYTTSLCLVNTDYDILLDKRIVLEVAPGSVGLRQQDAFFAHIKNLGTMFETCADILSTHTIDLIVVSEKPEAREDSYMPVFMAGYQFARALSAALGCPLLKSNHQAGHLRVCFGPTFPQDGQIKAFHLSGGTHKLLDAKIEDGVLSATPLLDTIDITAGQLLDRIGVLLGDPFPAGKYIDEAAQRGTPTISITQPKIKTGFAFSYSGAFTYLKSQLNCSRKEDLSNSLLTFIADDIIRALQAVSFSNDERCFLSGGVAASKTLRDRLCQSPFADAISFVPPIYATDNAVGIAFLGSDALNLPRSSKN